VATRRVLIAVGLAALAAPAGGQPPAKAAPVPIWVRKSAAAAGTGAFAAGMARFAHDAPDMDPLEAAQTAGNLAREGANLVRLNRALLGPRRVDRPHVQRVRGNLALSAAGIGFGLLAGGRMSGYEVGVHTVSTGASVVAASAAYAGMYGVATTFGTASTGVAISSLHGAAQMSAATAWLGGGATAAGGGGIAVGSVVATGGAALVAFGVVYGGFKLWDMADPAERDGFQMLCDGLLARHDLTDASTAAGSQLVEQSRRLRPRPEPR
jgi:hypothetical protein